ncbi:hypothetical protein HDU98_005351 [Podochytrium sp. JEL0797]|nr:hypothetical protein HDU98_005351 [Podochytrium sp. JEL0797]
MNRFTGTIGRNLHRLSELRNLTIHSNLFSGTLPRGLATRHAGLRVLNVQSNAFTGRFPTDLNALTNLEGLHLRGNAFTGRISLDLTRLVALTHVCLDEPNRPLVVSRELGRVLDGGGRRRGAGDWFQFMGGVEDSDEEEEGFYGGGPFGGYGFNPVGVDSDEEGSEDW